MVGNSNQVFFTFFLVDLENGLNSDFESLGNCKYLVLIEPAAAIHFTQSRRSSHFEKSLSITHFFIICVVILLRNIFS